MNLEEALSEDLRMALERAECLSPERLARHIEKTVSRGGSESSFQAEKRIPTGLFVFIHCCRRYVSLTTHCLCGETEVEAKAKAKAEVVEVEVEVRDMERTW
ncbi:hypothetical protein EGR_10032 [Echinococcus granulosus]|uniref:Uncharacterized protein n=1 Tax=Echinococcus granulosus TaxID=6210 RepID=W6U244_ECHGR|nr:hypothetical protein EGR_10032 [Echinococcus granulosus]EUB55123.1 hypothetical protein EGR_10032 [Echinococcus granulosus]